MSASQDLPRSRSSSRSSSSSTQMAAELEIDVQSPGTFSAPVLFREIDEHYIEESCTTIVSALPELPYRENPDGNRSLGYINAQKEVLYFLDNHAADELTPARATDFTETINPDGPSAKEALSLCLYMRSMGLPTRAKIGLGEITLYVAARINSFYIEVLYWHQDFRTDELLSAELRYQRALSSLTSYRPLPVFGPDNELLSPNIHHRAIDLAQEAGMIASHVSLTNTPSLHRYLPLIEVIAEEHIRNRDRSLYPDVDYYDSNGDYYGD